MFPRYQLFIRHLVALLPLVPAGDGASLNAEEPTSVTISAEIRESFEKKIQRLLVRACGDCHGKERAAWFGFRASSRKTDTTNPMALCPFARLSRVDYSALSPEGSSSPRVAQPAGRRCVIAEFRCRPK